MVAAHAPHRDEAFVDITETAAEGDECPGSDHPGYLTLEAALPATLEQFALQQEGGADIVGVPLDPGCLPLAVGAVFSGVGDLSRVRWLLAAADFGEEPAVHEQVRETADR